MDYVILEIWELSNILFKSEFDDILDDEGEITGPLGEYLAHHFPKRINVLYDEKIVITDNDDVVAYWQFNENDLSHVLWHDTGLYKFIKQREK